MHHYRLSQALGVGRAPFPAFPRPGCPISGFPRHGRGGRGHHYRLSQARGAPFPAFSRRVHHFRLSQARAGGGGEGAPFPALPLRVRHFRLSQAQGVPLPAFPGAGGTPFPARPRTGGGAILVLLLPESQYVTQGRSLRVGRFRSAAARRDIMRLRGVHKDIRSASSDAQASSCGASGPQGFLTQCRPRWLP